MSGRRVPVRLPGDEDDFSPIVGTFVRGLSLGALVGAALAGTLLLRRRRGRPSDTIAAGERAGGEDRDAIRP